MRTTLTFVLRLLVDTDDPQALRGMIRTVGSTEEHTFADGQALLALLHQMTGRVLRIPYSVAATRAISAV